MGEMERKRNGVEEEVGIEFDGDEWDGGSHCVGGNEDGRK